jgi:hypothetical protein
MLRITDAELADYTLRRKRVAESREEPAIKPKRKPFKLTRPEPTEGAVLNMILTALKIHPKIVWFERMNSAAGKLIYPDGNTSQFMRFGFVGMPDILGQVVGGRLLAIEVKKPSGRVSDDQQEFIDLANKHGAIAFVARSVADVLSVLDGL